MSSRVMASRWLSTGESSRRPAASLGEFLSRTRSRADSALTLISDSEFDAGQLAIEAAAAAVRESVPVIEVIELLAFRNGATRSAD